MKKKIGVKKLGKPADQRNALITSQVKDVFRHGYIKTTKTRAKVVSGKVDVLMAFVEDKNTKAIKDYIREEALTEKVLKLKVNGKRSGYTSLTALKNRAGDKAELVLIELLQNF